MTAHAPVIWAQLQKIAAQHGEQMTLQTEHGHDSSSADAAMQLQLVQTLLCSIAEMLYWCGGDAFQKHLHVVKQARGPSAVLLQAIQTEQPAVA